MGYFGVVCSKSGHNLIFLSAHVVVRYWLIKFLCCIASFCSVARGP